MSRNNWSFRFHNVVLPHSNDTLYRLQEFNPTPGNIGHIAHCEKIGIKRSETEWEKLFKQMCDKDDMGFRKGSNFRRFWWRTHAREIYWK